MKKFYTLIAAFALVAFAGIAQAETVTVSWSNVSGNQGYVIEAKAEACAGAGAFTFLANAATNQVVYTGGNFVPSSSACVRVAALVGGVPQTFSAGVDVTVAAALLPAPNTVSATSP